MSKKSQNMSEENADIKDMSFEVAASELEQIIRQLEEGKASLDESVKIYGRGVALKAHCDFKLSEAEAKVEKILIQKDGTAVLEPFDAQE
ncbi:MAG: exodeoxyribonuclease VII small subunit [Pseudomonadota bacterium]